MRFLIHLETLENTYNVNIFIVYVHTKQIIKRLLFTILYGILLFYIYYVFINILNT